MNFEDMPINEQFFAGFDKQTPKISHPWPREAEDRVNQLLSQLAAKELECQRLREALRDAAATERERLAKVCEATWEIDGSHTAAEFAALVRGA